MEESRDDKVLSIEQATELLNSLNWDDNEQTVNNKFTWDVESDEEDKEEPINDAIDNNDDNVISYENVADNTKGSTNKTIIIEENDQEIDDKSYAFKQVNTSNEEVMTIKNSSISLDISMSMLDQWKQQMDEYAAANNLNESNDKSVTS